MKQRRGVALLAALWLVVAIATVAMQFALEARERRTIGILAAERGIQRAAALGALAMMQAKLDYALRTGPTGNNVARLRAGDPWLNVDSTYRGTMYVDSLPVEVEAHDLGERLNINQLTENELLTFFSFLLKDYSKATQLSQTIMDWRDADSIPRPSGAEHDAYVKAEMLALPSNSQFRDISELRNVMGMTPEIFAIAAPFLTTHGTGQVNLNTAPVPVLRALPGMTDATVSVILQLRAQGRRISNINDVFPPQRRNARPGQGNTPQLQNALAGRVTTTTDQIEVTMVARVGPQAQPSKLTAIIARQGSANVTYKEW
jgi:general secretion pathway protein K